jgi:hypothetical protein
MMEEHYKFGPIFQKLDKKKEKLKKVKEKLERLKKK